MANEIKEFIEDKVRRREENYLNESSLIVQDYDRETKDWQAYHGRELLELLQNADDEITDEFPSNVKIAFDGESISVLNNGRPFTKPGINALMYSNDSPKRESERKLIGNKGTGFRSVLGWAKAIEINSGDLHIRFTHEYSQARLDRLNIRDGNRKFTAATLAFPEWIDSENSSGYTTEIKLFIKDDTDVVENIQKQIDDINGELLLFLNRITEITIENRGEVITYIKSYLENGDVLLQKRIGDNIVEQDVWFVNSSLDNVYGEKTYSVIVAYNRTKGMPKKQVLYSYFPTKIDFPFPVLIHANFELDGNRNHFVDNRENRAILDKCIDMLVDTAYKINADLSYNRLRFVIPSRSMCIELQEMDFESKLTNKIKRSLLFPTKSYEFKSFDSLLRYYPEGLARYVDGEGFADLLFYAEDDELESYIQSLYANEKFLIYNSSALIEKMNSWIDRLPKTEENIILIAKAVKAIIDEEYYEFNSNTAFLINDRSESVKNDHIIFVPSEEVEIDNIPTFIKVEFLHPVFVKYFLNECKGIIEDLIDYLAGFNVHLLTNDDILLVMNQEIEKIRYSNKPKARDYIIEQTKWMISNDINNSNVYVLDRNENAMKASVAYLGKEFGNKTGENILKVISTTCFVKDISALLGIKKSELKAWYVNNGIGLYPRRVTKELAWSYNYASHNSKGYFKMMFEELKYPQTIYGKGYHSSKELWKDLKEVKVSVETIENISSILEKCSTEEILDWIKHDNELSVSLTTHKEPISRDINVLTKGLRTPRTLQNREKPFSYIYWCFLQSKWIRVNDSKYSINDCILSLDDAINLEPCLAVPDVDTYIAELSGNKANLRNECNKIFDNLGVKRSFSELMVNKIYELLLLLPEIDETGKVSRTLYRQLLDDSAQIVKQLDESANYKKFKIEGKVFCRDKSYKSISDTHYVSGKDICDSLLDTVNIMDLPKARINYSNTTTLFGVERLEIKGVSLLSYEIHRLDERFQKDFSSYKTLAFAYRLDSLKKDIKNSAKKFSKLHVFLCSEIMIKHKREVIHLHDYDFFSPKANEYYLCVPNDCTDIHDQDIGMAISNIICSHINVYEPVAQFRELYNAGTDLRRRKILYATYDDAYIERALKFIIDSEGAKEEFLDIVSKISTLELESKHHKIIDEIDFDHFTSKVNSSLIIKLFKMLKIDVSEYNDENPSMKILLNDYYEDCIKNALPKYKNQFYSSWYFKLKDKGLDERCALQSKFLEYATAEIDVVNSVNYNVKRAIFNQLGIISNCEIVDFNSLYEQNQNVFLGRISDKKYYEEFMNNPTNASLLYYSEFDELQDRYEAYLKKEDAEEMRTLIDSNIPSANLVGDNAEIKPRVTISVEKKPISKTGYSSRKKNASNKRIGKKGEKVVYAFLMQHEEYTQVDWVSENGKEAHKCYEGNSSQGWDMEYTDKNNIRKYVEVKTSSSPITAGINFYLSSNEYDAARKHSDRYQVFYVADVNSNNPTICIIDDFIVDNEINAEKFYVESTEFYVSANYTVTSHS